jgi:hypothetical protein
LLFDKDYKFLDAAWDQIDGGEQIGESPKAAHDLLSKEVTIREAGHAFVYISNENPTYVEVYGACPDVRKGTMFLLRTHLPMSFNIMPACRSLT